MPAPQPDRPLQEPLLRWFDTCARDLPWRRGDATPWGVFVSEVMLQQTPVARVEPVWRAWLARWPSPAALAAESPGEAVRAWGRLGYPRRALRLHQAATAMVEQHGGAVPGSEQELRALPGVGAYTAAAVASFGFDLRATVVDTNVRRVIARAVQGMAQPSPVLTRAETALASGLLPDDPPTVKRWNVAVMELGALVCTARAPRCPQCPVAGLCAWRAAGSPAYDGPTRRVQTWHGTDRQVRGAILSVLRAAGGPVRAELLGEVVRPLGADATQCGRCLASLVADGLLEAEESGAYRLPTGRRNALADDSEDKARRPEAIAGRSPSA